MTEIPPNVVTQDDLNEWYRLQAELKRIKASEMLLRTKIFGFFFKAPVEGTNDAPLADGWVLKGKYNITREVDPGALGAMTDKLREAGVVIEKLVQYKPSLVLREYRELSDVQRHLMDQALIIKPGAPALEIVLPAKNKPKEA